MISNHSPVTWVLSPYLDCKFIKLQNFWVQRGPRNQMICSIKGHTLLSGLSLDMVQNSLHLGVPWWSNGQDSAFSLLFSPWSVNWDPMSSHCMLRPKKKKKKKFPSLNGNLNFCFPIVLRQASTLLLRNPEWDYHHSGERLCAYVYIFCSEKTYILMIGERSWRARNWMTECSRLCLP